MTRKKKAPRKSRPSEEAVRRDFERYQKLVADLNRRYAIEPLTTGERGAPASPTYTFEANFVYEIHART
jgi:hypothetical protein